MLNGIYNRVRRPIMGNMAYNREHTKTYLLRFNHKTDKDIIEKLDHVGNKMAYLKRLIREDLKRSAPDIDEMMDRAKDEL